MSVSTRKANMCSLQFDNVPVGVFKDAHCTIKTETSQFLVFRFFLVFFPVPSILCEIWCAVFVAGDECCSFA